MVSNEGRPRVGSRLRGVAWWLLPLAIVAAAVGAWQLRRLTSPGTIAVDEPFRALVGALASSGTRPIDGRLTGFAHARPPSRLRGPRPTDPGPEIRIAA